MLKQDKVFKAALDTKVQETSLSGGDLRDAAQQALAADREMSKKIKSLAISPIPEVRAFAAAFEQARAGRVVSNYAQIKKAATLAVAAASSDAA